VNLGVTANGWNGTARPGVANTWSLRAADRAGNATAASVARTPVVVSELSATRTGPWTGLRNSAYLSGHALRSTARGASMTWTFTGRSASLAASRTTVSGLVTVYVDGRAAGTLDLRAATVQNRQAVWARNWGASGTHTVRVVVAGTTGRPGAVLDGLVVLR
jgi:predicted ATPase